MKISSWNLGLVFNCSPKLLEFFRSKTFFYAGVLVAFKNRLQSLRFICIYAQPCKTLLFPFCTKKERMKFKNWEFTKTDSIEKKKEEKLQNFHIFQVEEKCISPKLSVFLSHSSIRCRVILHYPIVRQFNVVNLKRDRFAAKKDFFHFPPTRYFVNFPPLKKKCSLFIIVAYFFLVAFDPDVTATIFPIHVLPNSFVEVFYAFSKKDLIL